MHLLFGVLVRSRRSLLCFLIFLPALSIITAHLYDKIQLVNLIPLFSLLRALASALTQIIGVILTVDKRMVVA